MARFRKEFPTVENTVHLIGHSLGAMPAGAREGLNAYADQWTGRSIRAWNEGWWEMPRSVGNLMGRVIGAREGEVVMQPNVSIAQAIVLSCFDWKGRRNKIVSEDGNFPTNHYLNQESGARCVTAPVDGIADSIDDATALVSISHVLFRNARAQDVRAIAKRAHEVGALVMVDVYQSAGCMPVDVRAWGVDFACGGSVKWLCGGPGAGFLYVRPDLWKNLRPRVTGWMAHRAPFAFAEGPIEYADDAYRFLHGTPAIPALFAAKAGYELVLEAGIENIRAHSLRLTSLIIALARAKGLPVNSATDPATRGGIVVLGIPDGERIAEELLRQEVLVDFRPGAGIRIGPHFYNTEEEVRVVMDEIALLALGQ